MDKRKKYITPLTSQERVFIETVLAGVSNEYYTDPEHSDSKESIIEDEGWGDLWEDTEEE